MGTETVNAGNLGTKVCYKLSIGAKTDALKGKDKNLIWLTADAKKVPALMKFSIPVGTGQLTLTQQPDLIIMRKLFLIFSLFLLQFELYLPFYHWILLAFFPIGLALLFVFLTIKKIRSSQSTVTEMVVGCYLYLCLFVLGKTFLY